MIVVYPSHHLQHEPPHEVFNGHAEPHAEVPARIERIREALTGLPGTRFVSPKRFPQTWIERVHAKAYIDYLETAGRQAGQEYTYPSVFPYTADTKTINPVALRGRYSFDTYTPISDTTYRSARASVAAALTAASIVRRGSRVAYALCRPPGHHAEQAKMGGYCYFNNAAITADYLSVRGRVAVLDIDVHHGNGTQHLLYTRRDILTVSIHATPDEKFPYFSGFTEESGADEGIGYNRNYPLPLGTGDTAYDSVLGSALRLIAEHVPAYLVLSLGFDTHDSDPIGGFRLSTMYYRRIAGQISRLGIPTVILQEGGYNTTTIGANAVSFVSGFGTT